MWLFKWVVLSDVSVFNLKPPTIIFYIFFFIVVTSTCLFDRVFLETSCITPVASTSRGARRLGWSGRCRNEGDRDIWADRCGGALQGGLDREGPHPASHAEIQKTPGAGTDHTSQTAPFFTVGLDFLTCFGLSAPRVRYYYEYQLQQFLLTTLEP